ncbi:energy transducer TonB [Silvanigrella sp.]|uniref:energy transducer TonB n=1 Tax=Silvanigrella sp. TaxID=2024976 RepID=UPI0037C549AA
MEYFLYINSKDNEENYLTRVGYSILFHVFLVLAIVLIRQNPVEFIKISVSTNTIQLAAKNANSNKQTIQKPQEKQIPKEELVKSSTMPKQNIQKEIPADTSIPSAQAKSVANPTPEGQSSNPSKEFYSAESTVDKTAQCTLPEINLSEDATNAGVTSGSVIIEVQINSQGKVTEAKLIKGTGYKIDEIAIQAAKLLNCKAAKRENASVGVIKRINWIITP